ncbi:MAG: hypothetical protein HKN87_19840 [Saprospiraceae bacterium]|nr:hypothetical protein [Saprospiraceae bacterium]
MRLNTDPRLSDIELKNPAKMTLDELQVLQSKIYEIPPYELIKPEGKRMAKYLTKVNEELARRLCRK